MTGHNEPMDNNTLYDRYKSNGSCTMQYKDFFTDEHGYYNENAFRDFVQNLKYQEDDYYLICINIDLRLSNSHSRAKGDYELRKFISTLSDYFIFRIQGEKFNILARKEQISEIKTILDQPSDSYRVYYGIVLDAPFRPDNDIEAKAQIQKGISLMYSSKVESSCSGDKTDHKGNTPAELQETKLKKYRSTMWYGVIRLTITKPFYKELMVYVFPTEWKGNMQSMSAIVVCYDNLKFTTKYGSAIEFGVNTIRFAVDCRVDRQNHLAINLFCRDRERCDCDIRIDIHEGVCVPDNFGKRISDTKEIYPVRRNNSGFYSYVEFDGGAFSFVEDGIVTTPKGVRYGVTLDDTYIDLIQI